MRTCRSGSDLTTSAVRNTALFGRPVAGPSTMSTSSTVYPSLTATSSARSNANVPIRFRSDHVRRAEHGALRPPSGWPEHHVHLLDRVPLLDRDVQRPQQCERADPVPI